MSAYLHTSGFYVEYCCDCGVAFAMTEDMQRRRREDRKTFYCPSGHGQHYTGPSEAQKLRDEAQRQTAMREAAEARANRAEAERQAATRAHTKMRMRVMNGVCPCCNRTFQNLMRHMQNEHAGEFNLKTVRTAFGMTQAAVAHEAGVHQNNVSAFERGAHVNSRVRQRLEDWVSSQAPREATSTNEGV